MTQLNINGIDYPAKMTLGAIKRACKSTGSNDYNALFEKGIEGISAVVHESLVSGSNAGDLRYKLTQEGFDELVNITTVSELFTKLTNDSLPKSEAEAGSKNVN
jgi:hypothetical protein